MMAMMTTMMMLILLTFRWIRREPSLSLPTLLTLPQM